MSETDMITELTELQKKGLIEWHGHCLGIGRDTSPINRKTIERSWKKFYAMLNKKPPLFWYCQSPMQAQIIINIFPKITKFLFQNIRDNIGKNIWKNIRENIGENIWENIEENIGKNIRENIEENIRENIGENIGKNIRNNIWENIGENIRENIGKNIRKNIGENIGENIRENIGKNIRKNIGENIGENKIEWIDTFAWCQHGISWIGYYLFYYKYGLLPKDKNSSVMEIWYDLARSCGWCYTFEKIVFVSEKPHKININTQRQLHNETGMALEYTDGYGLYMLNGVRVPEWLVITPAEKIDPKLAIEEKNADIQREIIRKIGAEKMLLSLHAKEDDLYTDITGMVYKLMTMKIGNINRKYLYFEHASMPGIFYTKPVPPECRKALHARAWMLSLVENNELKHVTIQNEELIRANLPLIVS